jgi:hypothetical protein
LEKAIDDVRRMDRGSTPLYSSVVAAAHLLTEAPQPAAPSGDSIRLFVVISDGHSRYEKATQEEAIRAALSAGIPIYPVLVAVSYPYPDKDQDRYEQLAKSTGGRVFEFRGVPPDNLLDVVLQRLAEQIRYSYTAGYYPASGDESGHKVQVVLKNSGRGTVLGGARSVQH